MARRAVWQRMPLAALAALLLVLGAAPVASAAGPPGATAPPAAHAAGVAAGCTLDPAGNGFGALTGGPIPASEGLPPSTGNRKALMIFVEFSDAPHGSETTSSLYDLLVPSAQNWRSEVSYGRFTPTIDRMPGAPWLTMPHTASSYGLGQITFDKQLAYLTDAADAAGAAAPGFSFAGYDQLYVVPASSVGSKIPNSPAFVGGASDPIPTPDGNAIPSGASFGEDIHFDSPHYGSWILAHETNHTLGLPDLYAFGEGYPDLHRYVGSWDHMGWIKKGVHITAWQKLMLGWLDPAQAPCLTASTTTTITPLEEAGGTKAVVVRTGPHTALVAEDRQLLGQDAGLCDHGLLVYKVDATVATGQGPMRVQEAAAGQDSDQDQVDDCGLLYNATFDTGRAGKASTFTDSATGISIEVTGADGGDLTVAVTIPTVASTFVAVQPERLLDTRSSSHLGYSGPKPAAGQTVTLPVTGVGTAAVPSDASAVALNVTGVDATGDGFLTVYPCGQTRPTASNVNLLAHGTRPNAVMAKPGSGGAVCIYTFAGADIVVDITGYFTAGTSSTALQPERLLDTRSTGQVGYHGAKPAAGQVVTLQVTGAGTSALPSSARSVALNITGVGATDDGFVTAWPCDQPRPTASNLNLTRGSVIPNLAVVKLSAAGTVCLFTQQGTDLVADISAWFADTSPYAPVVPRRLLDTRPPGVGYTGAKPGAGATVAVDVVGSGPAAAAVVLNVTGIDATDDGFVTVWPCGTARPTTSDLNLVRGSIAPNLAIVRVGSNGTVCLFTQSGAHLAVDIGGSFPPT